MKSSTQSLQGRLTTKPLIKSLKKNPSQLIKDQSSGKSIVDQFPKPKIIQFLNIGDNSIHTDSHVDVDEPLFAPIPHVIQFTNYEPLQTKTAILTLRNKDSVARSIKIIPPDSKLFTVAPAKKSQRNKNANNNGAAPSMTQTMGSMGASMSTLKSGSEIDQMSTKVAPGMDISYVVTFSPEAKSDYAYDLMVMTEREKFIVPIRARGCRAMLDFPDQLDYGLVPVKYETEKPVMIRNIGEKTTKWSLTIPNSFKVDKTEGILEVGQSEQLVFHFVPQEARKFAEELTLAYDGLEAQIPVMGEAHNDNVYLSKGHIHTDPTSITLYSHQYFQVVNKSAVPIEFSWRAFATEMEENAKKSRLNLQLTQEENEEKDEIEQAIENGEDEDDEASLDSDDSYDADELAAKKIRKKQRAIATLARKYTSIRKAVDEDKMLFQDEIFQIEPLEGKIWPNTEMTCCVTFRPQGPYHYSCTAYSNVTCNQERLSLNLTGQGKGPQAQLSITEMDIGDIFVTSKKSFELGIENTGEIDCHWKLIPYETPFGSKFSFSKSEGVLGIKENQRDLLKVSFMSDILGEFSETFRFALEGSSEMLTLTFKGHVVAPTFHFSEDMIDFGKVSFKFKETKTVYLTNTSEVDINYQIRVPGDGRASLQPEFEITNAKGCLEKDKRAEIVIDFTPGFPQTYDMVLVVDLEGVGQDMLAVPIKAECLVPKVRVYPTEFLQYDECFLRHPKTLQISIINEDDLKARFEIAQQDEQSKRLGTYDVDLWKGEIEPRKTQVINVRLKTETLGAVRTNFVVKLDGHHIPVMMLLLAQSIGPIIEVDRHELDFGTVEVLRDYTQKIKIKNQSQIDAEYTAFTKNKESIWKVIQRYGVLKSDEEKTIEVVCNADDVTRFADTLYIVVNNGRDLEVALKARGNGSTLFCKEDLKCIDFGTEYTYKNVPRQFFLENRGRKQMKVMWVRVNQKKDKKKPAETKEGASATNASALKKTGSIMGESKDTEEQFVFTVVPDTITLGAKMGIMVEFRAFSQSIGHISEPWQCQIMSGNDRKPKPVFNSNIFADFITPTLQFNNPKIDFKYLWEKGVLAEPIIKDLIIRNTSPLKTTLSLKIEPPFNCLVEKLTLEKDAEDKVKIEFDPGMKQDRVSDHINGKLSISHEGHPHKDTVQLQGEVCFPNLQILPPKIDFGCILNDTSKKKYLVLTNVSEMPVAYEWSFLEDAPILDEQDEIDNEPGKKKKKKKKHLPINEVFDILPVSGTLLPNQTENIEFTYYSGNGLNYSGMAVCSVDGGPDYDIPISGDSSFVSYKLSTNSIDYGEVAYNDSSVKDFFIENVGKVPFEFNINLSTLSRPGVIECSHMTGKVLAQEKFKISVRFFPGVPDNIHEMFLVECGHFKPEKFSVSAVGIYPGILLSFPRAEDEDFVSRAEQTRMALEKKENKYTALFNGEDALKALPPMPPKMIEREKAEIKDTFEMDVQAECDRQLLCAKIIELAETGEISGENDKRSRAQSRRTNTAADGQKRGESVMSQTVGSGFDLNERSVNIANYMCDFGNVIITRTAKKSFRLTNTGKIPVTFNFDKRILNQSGISIEPDKVQKMNPNASAYFNVLLTTRKNSKFGKQKFFVPIEIKNGPKYTIEFCANVTIPELTLSVEQMDFDRVCVNTRKTMKIRIENKKEVPCDWNFQPEQQKRESNLTGSKSKEDKTDKGDRFQVWPLNGTLQPGQRQTVDVIFTPTADKLFMQKLNFKANQNAKLFPLQCKGQGINFMCDLVPETIKLGPVLPYDTSAIQEFEIRNPMDQPIEIFSLDFDKQYLDEEEIIKRIDNFQPNGSLEPLYLAQRIPGSEFWPTIKQQDESKRAIEAIRNQIKDVEQKLVDLDTAETQLAEYTRKKAEQEAATTSAAEGEKEAVAAAGEETEAKKSPKEAQQLKEPSMSQEEISEQRNTLTEEKGQLEERLSEMLTEQLEVKQTPVLKDDKKLNIILVGPQNCGQAVVGSYLSQEHQRGLIKLDQLVDFWQKRGHQLADDATAFLEQQEIKKQEALAEFEKKKKQKKGKKDDGEEFDEKEFEYLPKELLLQMLAKRLQEEDCNAGAIFDSLESKYWPGEKFAIELICEAVPVQNVQIVLFNFNKEKFASDEAQNEDAEKKSNSDQEGGDEESTEVCTNYRYARRHDPIHQNTTKNNEDQTNEQLDGAEAQAKKEKPKASGRAGRRGGAKEEKKSEAQIEAEERAAEEKRRIKEAEAERKRKDEQMRAEQKPAVYSEEDKSAWKEYCADLQQFFANLILKQSQQTGTAENENGDENTSQNNATEEKPATTADQNQDAQQDDGAENAENKENATEQAQKGQRFIREQNIEYDFLYLCDDIKKIVASPEWPDPDNEPLPPPLINSILKKPPNRGERPKITNFSIWTPLTPEEIAKQKEEEAMNSEGEAKPVDGEAAEEQEQEGGLPQMSDKRHRWVLQPKESKKLYVKFFSTKTGHFKQVLQFELVGSYKPFNLNTEGHCEFPTISQNPKNLFMQQKKSRPATEPESFLSKTFVVNENTFDFGPLLIGKDPETRTDETVKQVNGTFFRITNNGKYDLEANFTLKSTLSFEEGGPEGKSPFLVEPQEATLKVDETLELWVYAFPEEAQLYSDEVICLLKDNPNPTVLNVQCLGAKPIVTLDQEVVKFERALIGKKPKQDLVLKNACAIPINWKLTGVEALSEEFSVGIPIEVAKPKEDAGSRMTRTMRAKKAQEEAAAKEADDNKSQKEPEPVQLRTSGRLEPYKTETVEIAFNSLKEQKFLEQIKLEVEDVEAQGVKQEEKTVQLDAEAFDITLNEEMQTDLDFGNVRVGEPKELPLYLKNQGQYPISYDFKMKKQSTKQIFTITPMEGKLQPNEDINIMVKFLSQVEKKLTMNKQNSDILLTILEGEQQEKHQEIPILVSVNAVFSKFTISPLRNLNFGPMLDGQEAKRTFEIRNDGLFEFNYAICDDSNEEEKQKILEQRQREKDGLAAAAEEEGEDKKGKGAKKAEAKAPKAGKGKESALEGTVVQVGQYQVSPAVGSIPKGSSAIVTVQFNALGSKFYDSTLCIDIANREQVDGLQFQLCAESSVPGINTNDFDQIFEEQTVIPSLDPNVNTQTIVSSSLFSMQENVFWFGTMVASKSPEGTRERFKIINPFKIPCTVKFAVKPRSQSKSEGFAFDVEPEGLTIDPHKHKYVSVGFHPTSMMQYSGIFEAIVESGDPEAKSGKLVFELRGEGTLPTLQCEKPEETDADGIPVLKFKKTRVGKEVILPLLLKNEGQVPATARFDAITNENFVFEGNMNQTITQKSSQKFDIRFKPSKDGQEKFALTFSTLNNVYEQHKVMLVGEGFSENITFEGLPEDYEDELHVGDCVIGKARAAQFTIVNSGDKDVKFRWNSGDKDEFRFYPAIGHLKSHSQKRIKVMVRGTTPKEYDLVDLVCEVTPIQQTAVASGNSVFTDWDDTMKTLQMVRPSYYKKIMKQREDEEQKRKEQAELAAQAAAGKKGGKAPPKKKDEAAEEEFEVDMTEEESMELIEVLPEPEITEDEAEKKEIKLKTSCVIDYATYECSVDRVDFKPTLMYAQRTFKFTMKNTSKINLNYHFKIANSQSGVLDAGAYSIIPKKGLIAPSCDENFIVKFSPVEIESDFSRIFSANIQHLSPEQDPLIIEANGIAERPIIHFELQPNNYRERKEKEMSSIDSKFKIIEFESLGTNIKNTKRFMAVNPTSGGYEYEWEEIVEDTVKQKPQFKCMTPRGLILSGKKSEMTFEYTPDSVGEHESKWLFKIPSENIQQYFLIVGRVNEPNVLLNSGKIKFGPLLLQGKNKEVIKIINQEHIPFAFNFNKDSVRGNVDFGDSLRVSPMSGVVPALSELPLEVTFTPRYELKYNYNLCCNVKRKNRPLILNVKGEGYKIHHSVFADEPRQPVKGGTPFNLDFGEFFINEKKQKQVVLMNNGEFNFDFMWRRQTNKYVKITPETGTVQKGSEVVIDIEYTPISEHQLNNFKMVLSLVSGPRYEFSLTGKARKPGVKLNSNLFDFGPSFVTSQPGPITKMLEITNQDAQAISIESNFEKKNYLDFQIVPGQVIMPDEKLEIPIIFTPREIKKYEESIKLDFNGLYFVDMKIMGQGIPMHLDLKDPEHHKVDMGTISVDGKSNRTIPLINRSIKPVKFSIFPATSAFEKQDLSLKLPGNKLTDIVLKPKEQLPIEIKFRPTVRMLNFAHDVMIRIEGLEENRKLFTVSGVAQGIELRVMDDILAFGSVVKDSRLTKSIQMSNFGDVQAHFDWDLKGSNKNFTISPIKGFVNPNSNLDLEITFHPATEDPEITQKAICSVQGGEPINLTIMGTCVAQDGSQTQDLNFNTMVRKTVTQTVAIQNTEEREWAINPTISTKSADVASFFVGKPTMVVPAKGTAQYEITYQPKTMTKKQKAAEGDEMVDVPHQGSLFFPLPNGTALLYNLLGVATEPESEGQITETVSAKHQKNLLVAVKNQDKKTQRFTAEWTVEGDSQSLFIRGAKMFDVAGESYKDYKLNFLALRSGLYKFRTTFRNQATGEYQFYEFAVTVEDNKDVETFELVSPIRESVSQSIIIENPTEQDVEIDKSQFTIGNEYVEIYPENITIKGKDSREFQVKYLPLMISESESDLILKNPTLGDFNYKLLLKGIAPTSQRSLAFKCALGQDSMQSFKFTHFLKKATTYQVKVERIDGPGACDFKSEAPTVQAPAAESNKGVELQVNVRYEPFTIGDSRGVLKLTSAEGMEYSCLLFGKSVAPQPQGPIKCASGGKSGGIDFKNPLNEKCEFVVTFDNPNFSLASKLPGPLDPGKATNLQIKFEGKADLPNTGRMIVSTKGLPPWIYYLQNE